MSGATKSINPQKNDNNLKTNRGSYIYQLMWYKFFCCSGNIKIEDLFYYLKNKEKCQKPLKRKDYLDAFEQIEAAIKKDGGDGDSSPNVDDSIENVSKILVSE